MYYVILFNNTEIVSTRKCELPTFFFYKYLKREKCRIQIYSKPSQMVFFSNDLLLHLNLKKNNNAALVWGLRWNDSK